MVTNIRDLDLNLLLALDALYEERNVTRAADRLALTQPTVSGMLKRLRDLFGDALYVRTSHGVVPTPRAEALVAPVKEIIAMTQALLEQQEFDPAVSEFEVKLCGSDYIHNALLAPLAGEILSKAPGARVSLIPQPSGNLELPLIHGDMDILFSARDFMSPTQDGVSLYQDTLVCMSSYRAHQSGQKVALDTLCDLSHVILNNAGAPVTQKINAALHDQGLTRNIVINVPNFAAVFQAMAHTELIAFLPGQMAHRSAGQFKKLNVALKMPITEVIASWHPRMNNDPRHLWVRDRLHETLSMLEVQRLPIG